MLRHLLTTTTAPGWMIALLTGVVAAVASAAILRLLLQTGWAWRLATDMPNERSLHLRPTPRVGGWGLISSAVAALVLVAPALWSVALGTAFLAVVSQIDDRRGLSARVRFTAHLVAVLGFVALYPAPVPWWALACLVLLLLWLVNLYNFMDGSDGLAGGMAFFGFTGYALAALSARHAELDLAWGAAAVAGAALGFLRFNFPPARIFLGDAGSIPLGFLAGALGYWGWQRGVWPLWFTAMVFAPFIADASLTLLRRLLRGERFWQAHREHYYQRMVRSGMGHAATARVWYGVMAAGIMLALYLLDSPEVIQWCVVSAWMILLCLLGLAVDRRWHRYQASLSE
ncbi:glycosyl transferase [Paraburkholderia bonniea]|uniref:glycosyl transferase n=1 Tax=Paraburkholderia bonniea TaxID=2152891 RepID=UPI001291D35C|nr:glycosyl transferase [Paraburkholderia bonniea]WJF89579.1 glycosyl transferase [Paraburkholderia bonniea]WJF92893.1 glycosyl transferase [Paraburkholderia bonniea]